MPLHIQYHNCDKRGLAYLLSPDNRFGISTRRSHVKNAQGTVFLIVGIGKPRQFFLWETFEIEAIDEESDGTYIAHGPGWQLSPPQRLDGPDFEAFKSSCANFVGFRNVDDLPYSATLKKLAKKFRAVCSAKVKQSFFQDLLGLLRDGTEDYDLVLKLLKHKPASMKLTASPKPKEAVAISKTKTSARKTATPASPQSSQTKKLRALSIRQPHAEAIMRGVKKIEYRSLRTQIRGRVQIYASLGRYSAEDEAEMLEKYGIDDMSCDQLPRGVLIGTVEILHCTEGEGEYHWHLEKPKRATRLLKPKKHPQPVWFNPF